MNLRHAQLRSHRGYSAGCVDIRLPSITLNGTQTEILEKRGFSDEGAWYEKQGPARDVLVVGEMLDPRPGAGEVRIRIAAFGINPGDVKKRQDSFGLGMPYPRVIPHSDGAGQVDHVGL